MEAGPSYHSRTEMRRLEERSLLTLPKAEKALLCMGWPALGDELREWRLAHFPSFEAELRREESWAGSIKESREAARGAAKAERAAATAARGVPSAAP
eukprot:gene11925-24136_t